MLATPTTAVKGHALTTPEQRGCATAIDHSLQIFWTLVERLQAAADQQQPLHQVEETISRDLLAMGFSLLRAFLALAGDGDVGPTCEVSDEANSDGPLVLPRLEPPRSRPDLSIFGATTIARACYGRDRVEAAPLDARLHLPRRQYSYLFQQWLGAFVINDAHAEAIQKLQTILGLGIAVKASEDLNREQASDVVVFQGSQPGPAPDEEGPLLVVTADCKGVPLVRSTLGPEEETSPAETAVPQATANPLGARGRKPTRRRWRRWGRSTPSNRLYARRTT